MAAKKKKVAAKKKVARKKSNVSARATTIDQVYVLLKTVATNRTTGLPKVISDLKVLKNKTGDLSKLDDIEKTVNHSQHGLGTITKRINNANNTLTTVSNKLAALGKLGGIDNSVNNIKSTITSQAQKLNTIHSKIGKLDTIDSIQKVLTNQTHGIVAISNGIKTAVKDLGTLSNSVQKLQSLTKLESYLKDPSKGIPGIKTELKNIINSVSDIVGNSQHGLKQITTGINTATNKISSLVDAVGTPAQAEDIKNALKDDDYGLPTLERGLNDLGRRLDDLGKRPAENIELSLGSRGELVGKLHEVLLKLNEKYANPRFAVPKNEVNAKLFGTGTQKAVRYFQRWDGLRVTGTVNEETRNALAKALAQVDEQIYRVEGHIYYSDGLPVIQASLELYRVDFQKSSKIRQQNIVDIVGPDDKGSYVVSYKPPASKFNIEVRGKSDNKVIANSGTIYNATEHEVVNLVVEKDQRQQASEFNTLNQEVTQALNGKKLRDAHENETQRDITLLHESTGWDARLIAMAATSDKLRGDIDDAIPLEGLYGLMRLGLPATADGLVRLSEDTVAKALSAAREKEIISSAAETQTFKKFKTWSRDQRKKTTVPGSLSTPESILKSLKLPAAQEKIFWKKYFDHQCEPKKLWTSLKKQNLPVEKMQVQGKLSLLTLNNEPLIKKLWTINAIKNSTPETTGPELIKQGFHKAEKWESYLQTNLLNNNLNNVASNIPPVYTGENNEQVLKSYASDLARKLRISYPTQVLAKYVADQEINLGKEGQQFANKVDKVIQRAIGKGFRFGRQALNQFVREHEGELFQGMGGDKEVIRQDLKRLQGAFNLAPQTETVKILLANGFESAEQIMAYTKDEFVRRFGHLFTGQAEPRLIHDRASEVQSVTYSFVADAQALESVPEIQGLSLPAADREVVRDSLIRQFPTVEALFGSQDFCECEHCRSILSPAAYLVDILQFLDPDDNGEQAPWQSFLKEWERTHNGNAYTDKYGVPGEGSKPYDVLIERRPDLAYLPLTCENTHTQLPYVDIVNEILEYYVVKGELDQDTAHDTGSTSTAELLAEPQHLLEPAYETLRNAEYPVSLPFDLWHETIRLFSEHFQIPFWKILDATRTTDELVDDNNEPNREHVFREYLGILPKEWEIYTRDRSPGGEQDPVEWFKLYGYNNENEALNGTQDGDGNYIIVPLISAKELSRRLDVTYKELATLVTTWFVNPGLRHWDTLRRIGISSGQAWRYQTHKDLLSRNLDTLSDAEKLILEELNAVHERLTEYDKHYKKIDDQFNVFQWLDDNWENLDPPVGDTLVLHDPDVGCNFDSTTLRHADGNEATALEFFRLNLFVRLRKRLRWSINELDRVLEVLMPGDVTGLTTGNIGKYLRTGLIYLSHLKEMHDRLPNKRGTRADLVYLWADLATKGKNALYTGLFLKESSQEPDEKFDHPTGQYLSNLTDDDTLDQYLLRLQGALELTVEDMVDVLCCEDPALSRDEALSETKLSLEVISTLYRYRQFAKRMKLSISELIILKQITGMDPFVRPPATPIVQPGQDSSIDNDVLYTGALKFVEQDADLKDSGLKITDLDYLARHRFDAVGPYRDSHEEVLGFCKQLITAIQQADSILPADNQADVTDDELKSLMSLVLPGDIVTKFFAMKTGASEWTGIVENVEEDDKLDPLEFVNGKIIIRLQYDRVLKRQLLTYRGVLTDGWKNRLRAEQQANALFISLLEDVERQIKIFFKRNLKKSEANNSEVGFLTDADFETLFKPLPDNATAKQIEEAETEKRNTLRQAFRPYLQKQLRRQAVTQQFSNRHGIPAELTESLLINSDLLHLPGQDDIAFMPNLEQVQQGVSVECYPSNDLTGAVNRERAFANPALAPDAEPNMIENKYAGYFQPPTGTKSVRFNGYLEVPVSGTYHFIMKLQKQDAAAHLMLNADPDWSMQHKAVKENDEYVDHIELEAGIPYRFSIEATDLNGSEHETGYFALLVRSDNLPEGHLQRVTLYPDQVVTETQQVDTLLKKTLLLVDKLELGQRELVYILTHKSDFEDIDLSRLPISETDANAEAAEKLFKQIMAVADYKLLRQEIANGTEDLIDLLELTTTGIEQQGDDQDTEKQRLLTLVVENLAELVRRQNAEIENAITTLGYTPELVDNRAVMPVLGKTDNLLRLWILLRIAKTYGVDADQIKRWANPEPDAATAKHIRATLKANYSHETWFSIIRPIQDVLRKKQRDALVSYLLTVLNYQRPEQLFEHFLVDPGMEPVVKTSRIRLAISSVQLFIQRCLMNYEPQVHPSTINSAHWEWMKRYRVWEANRKIFLYPENWLEPEFRDDKSFMFNELESALLQGDIDNDSAETAFLHYLRQLNELARLEIVTLYCEEKPLTPGANTVHVIGRTYNLPHKYFYRRYAYGRWTAWEPVTAEVEGDHVVAAMWRGRLNLFWVTFLEEGEDAIPDDQDYDTFRFEKIALMKRVRLQLSHSEYYQGEWSEQNASGFDLIDEGTTKPLSIVVYNNFSKEDVTLHVSKEYDQGLERAIRIELHMYNARLVGSSSRGQAQHQNPFFMINMPANVSVGMTERNSILDNLMSYFYRGTKNKALRLTGKNALPTGVSGQDERKFQYGDRAGKMASLLYGKNKLSVSYIEYSSVEEYSNEKEAPMVTRPILENSDAYSLVLPSADLSLVPDWVSPYVSPCFYQDHEHTFFVEPRLEENSFEKWEEWVIPMQPAGPAYNKDEYWQELPLARQGPSNLEQWKELASEAGWIEQEVVERLKLKQDWLTDESTVVTFGERVISSKGSRQPIAYYGKPKHISSLNVVGPSGLSISQINRVLGTNR